MYRTLALAIPALMLLATVNVGAAPVVEDAAVLNGGFEIAAHQVRPTTCDTLGDGYINVFEPGNPAGLPWLAAVNACEAGAVTAFQWSHGKTTQYGDFDGDGDREAKFVPGIVDPVIGGHNQWQAYTSHHQAYTAGFEAYTFRLESGALPKNAVIILSLSQNPVSDVTPWAGIFFECQLTLRASQFVVVNGVHTMDPVAGTFASRDPGCADEKAEWDAATTPDAKRAVLAKLRIVQNSFWSWHTGAGPVVIDDVAILGAPLAAETLAANAANGQLPGGPSL